MDFCCVVTLITSSWTVYSLVCLKTQIFILQKCSFIFKIFLRAESSFMLADLYHIFIFRKRRKTTCCAQQVFISGQRMKSQIKECISPLPCDTKSDFKSLLLVQSVLEAEEVTLCKSVYDTQCCCALVLCIQSIESWTLFSLIENPSQCLTITKLQHHGCWTFLDACIHHTRWSKWNCVTDIVLRCGDELFLPLITTPATEYMAVIAHFHIPFGSSNID